MSSLTKLIKRILPAILAVSPTDDGALFITYSTPQGNKDTIVPLTDYEKATGKSKRIDGLFDTIGLSM